MNKQKITEGKQKTYVCLGTCQAVISEERYKNGLTKCGTKECTLYGKPFVQGKKSETTGKTIKKN